MAIAKKSAKSAVTTKNKKSVTAATRSAKPSATPKLQKPAIAPHRKKSAAAASRSTKPSATPKLQKSAIAPHRKRSAAAPGSAKSPVAIQRKKVAVVVSKSEIPAVVPASAKSAVITSTSRSSIIAPKSSSNKTLENTALKLGTGAALGLTSGLLSAAQASQLPNSPLGPGLINASSRYVHSVTKSLKGPHHKTIGSALVAGGAAAHLFGGAVVSTFAMPVLLTTAAGYGLFRLGKFIKEKI